MAYTAPALSIPVVLDGGYTPPPGHAVDLQLTGAYAPPLGNAVALILGDSGASAITGTAATGQGQQSAGTATADEQPVIVLGGGWSRRRIIPHVPRLPGTVQAGQTTTAVGWVGPFQDKRNPAWLARLRAEDELLMLL